MDRDEIRERFSPLLDGELSPEERAEVEAALSEDAELLRELDALKRVDRLYSNLPPLTAPDGFEDGVRSALRPATKPFVRAVHRSLWPLLAAAAVFIVFGAIVMLQMNPDMAPMLLSNRMERSAAESALTQELSQPDLAAESMSADQTFAPQSLDDASGDPLSYEEPETDMDTVREFGAVSSGRSNGDYRRGQIVMKDESSAGDAGMRAEPMPASPPEGARITGRSSEKGLAELVPSPQRKAGGGEEGEMSPSAPGQSLAAKSVEPAPTSKPLADAVPMSEPINLPSPDGLEMLGRSVDDAPTKDFAEQEAAAVPPQGAMESMEGAKRKLAERTFDRKGEDWIQDGYDNETLTTVHRESEAWNVLVRKDFILTTLLELEGKVVFKQGDIWYELLPAITSDR